LRVVGVQPENAPAMHAALAAGRVGAVAEEPTIADGLAGNLEQGTITFPIVRRLVEEVVLVGEPSIERAMAGFIEHEHMVVEGSGAVVAAAILEERLTALAGRPLGLLVTGRNVGLARLRAILDKRYQS